MSYPTNTKIPAHRIVLNRVAMTVRMFFKLFFPLAKHCRIIYSRQAGSWSVWIGVIVVIYLVGRTVPQSFGNFLILPTRWAQFVISVAIKAKRW